MQGAKTWSSRHGLRYSLQQAFTYSGMTDVMRGDNNLGNYNLDLPPSGRCSICVATGGTAGWISAQIEYQAALGGGRTAAERRRPTSAP